MTKHIRAGIYILILALAFGALFSIGLTHYALISHDGQVAFSDSTKGYLKTHRTKNGLAQIQIVHRSTKQASPVLGGVSKINRLGVFNDH